MNFLLIALVSAFLLMFFPPLILSFKIFNVRYHLLFLILALFILNLHLINGLVGGLVAIYFSFSSYLVYDIFVNKQNSFYYLLITFCFFVILSLLKNEGIVMVTILLSTMIIINISKKMIEIMKSTPGAGLAANQIGILKKIITINIQDHERETEKVYALFNPSIKSYSAETVAMEEACLSFPKQFIEIERPASIEIEYTNENNKIIKGEKNGYEARVLQHEIDHLSGKLFVDYLSSLKRNMIIKRVQKLKKMGEI